MKLDIKAMALTAGILWAACFFLTGVVNLVWPWYGGAFLALGASIYPGYHGPGGFGSVIVVTLYALLDGLVCGAVFAWVYNRFAGGGATA
jgi:hypothetical protein